LLGVKRGEGIAAPMRRRSLSLAVTCSPSAKKPPARERCSPVWQRFTTDTRLHPALHEFEPVVILVMGVLIGALI
jgi:hypothetical protein